MMRKFALLLLIAAQGCSPVSDYFTTQGVGVMCLTDDGICPDPAELDDAIEHFAHWTSYADIDRLLPRLKIRFVTDLQYAGIPRSGLFYASGRILLRMAEIEDMPLFHEFTHAVVYVLYNSMDYQHNIHVEYWELESEITRMYRDRD
jgi:hypothetical protein